MKKALAVGVVVAAMAVAAPATGVERDAYVPRP